MFNTMSANARRLGVSGGVAIGLLGLLYLIALAGGLFSLTSPEQQIPDPWFTCMEVLIILLAPCMVAVSAAIHEGSLPARRIFSLVSMAFMCMTAALTCTVHFAVLTLSRNPTFAHTEWADLLFSFTWPSIAYALDILAWDIFFPIAAVCAAVALRGLPMLGTVRMLLTASAVLAFVGLAGVPLADMRIRNIGIVGYAVLYPVAAAMLAYRWHRHPSAPGI